MKKQIFILLSLSLIVFYSSLNALFFKSTDLPWRSIGLLEIGDHKCSVVVVGKNKLLTSGYCLINKTSGQLYNKQALSKARIYLGYDNGYSLLTLTPIAIMKSQFKFPPSNIYDLEKSSGIITTLETINTDIFPILKINYNNIDKSYISSHHLILSGFMNTEVKKQDIPKGTDYDPSYSKNVSKSKINYNTSLQCYIREDIITFNSSAQEKKSPILLTQCEDGHDFLLGTPLFGINKSNDIEVLGFKTAAVKNNVTKYDVVVPLYTHSNK